MCKKDIIYSSVSKGKVQDGGGGGKSFLNTPMWLIDFFITKLSET